MNNKSVATLAAILFCIVSGCGFTATSNNILTNTPNTMEIYVPALENGIIPRTYTCDGQDTNPEIKISGTPANAVALVLTIDDPDAPGSTYDHWIVWNIPPKTTDIAANSVPTRAIVGLNSAGTNKYTPPCPPSGEHRYVFTVYALDISVNLPSATSKNELLAAVSGHILAKDEAIGRYSRN